MTAKTTITLTDATSTGAGPSAESRVFTPGGMEGNVHTFSNDFIGGTAALKSRLTASLRPSTSQRKQERVKFILSVPQSKTEDGLTVQNHVDHAYIEFVFDEDATVDNRIDMYRLVESLFDDAGVQGMVANGEDLY